MATLHTGCARVRARIRSRHVREWKSLYDGPVAMLGMMPPYRIAAGTPMTWPDGTPAGKTRRRIAFDQVHATQADGRQCFIEGVRWYAHGGPSEGQGFTLCFAADQVSHEPVD